MNTELRTIENLNWLAGETVGYIENRLMSHGFQGKDRKNHEGHTVDVSRVGKSDGEYTYFSVTPFVAGGYVIVEGESIYKNSRPYTPRWYVRTINDALKVAAAVSKRAEKVIVEAEELERMRAQAAYERGRSQKALDEVVVRVPELGGEGNFKRTRIGRLQVDVESSGTFNLTGLTVTVHGSSLTADEVVALIEKLKAL